MSGAPPDDRLYLHHILDAIARIESYLAGVDAQEFQSTPLLQDGVIRQPEIIGEAAKRVSEGLREQAQDLRELKSAVSERLAVPGTGSNSA